MHLWQIQPVRDLLAIAAVIGVLYIGYRISIVTVPLLLALLMAYLFEPLSRALTSRGYLSRKGVAIGIIAAVVLTVLVPVTFGLTYSVIQGVGYAGKVSDQIRSVLASVEKPQDDDLRARIRGEAWLDIRDWLVERRARERGGAARPDAPPSPPSPPASPADRDGPSGDASTPPSGQAMAEPGEGAGATLPEPVEEESSTARMLTRIMAWVEQNAAGIAQTLGKTAVGSGAQAVGVVVGTFVSIGTIGFGLFLTMFFFFFFSTGWGKVLAYGEKFIPDAGRYRWMRIIKRMDRVVAGFVRGRLTICAILAVYMTIAYAVIGVPAWMLLGPVIGMLFIVPFVHVIGVPIAMLLMWLQSDATGFRAEWWWIILAPIAVYVIAQFLDDWVLTPTIQGNNTDMDTPTILFASIAGGALAGIYGLLIAIPVAACLKILANEFLWPRIEAWVKGKVQDPLPISRE